MVLFAMLLFLAVPFKVKAETATTPVSISVQYGQTEARTILNMINEMRTSSTDAWYWKQDDTTKTYCTNLQPLQYDYDLEKSSYAKGPLKLQLFIPIHVQITKTPSPHFMKIQYIILMQAKI